MPSRNAATGDNSMYYMIPDPLPSSAFGKGSTTPVYIVAIVIIRTGFNTYRTQIIQRAKRR